MIDDYAHAATLQARHEGDDPDVGIFTADAHCRAIAACAGILEARGVSNERTGLEDVLAEAVHELNSESPDDADARDAEWQEAYRVAGLLIRDYAKSPAAAATFLMGAGK